MAHVILNDYQSMSLQAGLASRLIDTNDFLVYFYKAISQLKLFDWRQDPSLEI